MSKNVLIYAPRKSGSSLTQCLLDNNYQFTHPNESKLIYFDRVVGNHKDYHFVENNLSSIFQFRFEKDLPIDLPNKILSALPFITNIEKFLRFDLELAQNYSYNIRYVISLMMVLLLKRLVEFQTKSLVGFYKLSQMAF